MPSISEVEAQEAQSAAPETMPGVTNRLGGFLTVFVRRGWWFPNEIHGRLTQSEVGSAAQVLTERRGHWFHRR